MSFSDSAAVAQYAVNLVKQVPGLHALHKMAHVLLAERVPANGRVLVLGAGGGMELKALAQASPAWRFTGVDPSPEMLALAKRTLGKFACRVDFVEGLVESAPDREFDGATCLLTLHFLINDMLMALFFAIAAKEVWEAVILREKRRITASGSGAVFDLMLRLIEERLGRQCMTEVACWFQHPFVRDADASLGILDELTRMGAKISIDDFGTGYSSLLYLKRLPASELKIDRAFVRELESNAEDAAIVSSIIALGKTLNLRVVAEGVETLGQRQQLRRLGCDLYQGYLMGEPMEADALFAAQAARQRA